MVIGASGVTHHMRQIDSDILLLLNHGAANNFYLLKAVRALGDNPMMRGLPLFACVTYLWFSREQVETKCRTLIGILATSLALAFSLLAQHTLAIHVRPL